MAAIACVGRVGAVQLLRGEREHARDVDARRSRRRRRRPARRRGRSGGPGSRGGRCTRRRTRWPATSRAGPRRGSPAAGRSGRRRRRRRRRRAGRGRRATRSRPTSTLPRKRKPGRSAIFSNARETDLMLRDGRGRRRAGRDPTASAAARSGRPPPGRRRRAGRPRRRSPPARSRRSRRGGDPSARMLVAVRRGRLRKTPQAGSVAAAGAAAVRALGRRLALGDLERLAAAARGDRVRVVDLEPGLLDASRGSRRSTPLRYGALNGSTTTLTPWNSNSWSPSWAPRSKPRPYWKPEQPPPSIATRSTDDVRLLGHQPADLPGGRRGQRARCSRCAPGVSIRSAIVPTATALRRVPGGGRFVTAVSRGAFLVVAREPSCGLRR